MSSAVSRIAEKKRGRRGKGTQKTKELLSLVICAVGGLYVVVQY